VATGQDNPIGLFGYLLLLNVGLAWVAYKKRWPLLTAISLGLTTVYQWGWVSRFLTSGKLPLAAAIFLIFPIMSFVALALNRTEKSDEAAGSHRPFAHAARIGAARRARRAAPALRLSGARPVGATHRIAGAAVWCVARAPCGVLRVCRLPAPGCRSFHRRVLRRRCRGDLVVKVPHAGAAPPCARPVRRVRSV